MVIRKYCKRRGHAAQTEPSEPDVRNEVQKDDEEKQVAKRKNVFDPFDDDYIGSGSSFVDDDEDDLKLPSKRFDSSKIDKVKRAKLDFESKLDKQLKETEASIHEHQRMAEEKKSRVSNEHEIIDNGKKKGYPSEVDEKTLLKIMDDQFVAKMRKILNGTIPSRNYDDTKAYAQKSSNHYISSGEVIVKNMIPGMGYYGNKGREIIGLKLMELSPDVRSLQKKKENSWMLKFDDSTLLELLLYQEAMVHIIMHEKAVDYKQARRVLEESSAYGNLYFS